MIRNERFVGGVCISAEVFDTDTNTYTKEEYGAVAMTRPMTADEIDATTPPVDVKAELLAQIEQATTLSKLRAAVLAAIEAGTL